MSRSKLFKVKDILHCYFLFTLFSYFQATAMFAEKAASLESTSALAMAEVGQQCLLRGKIKEAQRYYKVSCKLK